jgi:hypothetical protein
MRPPFYRACRKHKEELEDRSTNSGPEILWCHRGSSQGHRCRSWLVLDGDGETLAVAYLNVAPKIVSAELAKIDFPIPSPPDDFCKRGHYEWYLRSDGRYSCRICKRDLILKRYHSRPKVERKPKYTKKGRPKTRRSKEEILASRRAAVRRYYASLKKEHPERLKHYESLRNANRKNRRSKQACQRTSPNP